MVLPKSIIVLIGRNQGRGDRFKKKKKTLCAFSQVLRALYKTKYTYGYAKLYSPFKVKT